MENEDSEIEDGGMEDWIKIREEAEGIKNALKLDSIDTALLMMIYQDLDTIRFYNSD